MPVVAVQTWAVVQVFFTWGGSVVFSGEMRFPYKFYCGRPGHPLAVVRTEEHSTVMVRLEDCHVEWRDTFSWAQQRSEFACMPAARVLFACPQQEDGDLEKASSGSVDLCGGDGRDRFGFTLGDLAGLASALDCASSSILGTGGCPDRQGPDGREFRCDVEAGGVDAVEKTLKEPDGFAA